MMKYDVNYYHADVDQTGSDIPGCGRNWCQIWQSGLVDHCDPPEERMVDGIMCHYSLLPTLEEIPTPHAGLQPRIVFDGSLESPTPWIADSERMTDGEIFFTRRDHPAEYTECRLEALRRVEGIRNSLRKDRGVDNPPMEEIPAEIFLRVKGVFVACPRCWRMKGVVAPVRVGQFMCLNYNCWRDVRWTPPGDATIHVDSLRARANMYEDSLFEGKKPKNMGKHSMEIRFRRAFAIPILKHRHKSDAKLLSKDGLCLPHGLAWAAAGGTWAYPRPYQVCPWDSDNTEYPGYEWEDLFPPTFPLMVRQFMNQHGRKEFQIHSREERRNQT
jgi:hypothetical protein